jgi:hypothetical protein
MMWTKHSNFNLATSRTCGEGSVSPISPNSPQTTYLQMLLIELHVSMDDFSCYTTQYSMTQLFALG